MQEIVAYIIIGVAVGYTIYSVVKKFSRKNDKPTCGCNDCSCCVKNVQCKTKINN